MKLNQIRDFVAVARAGSLRAASRDLGIAQPSITKSIQALEQELGAPLFQRNVRGTNLTALGTVFRKRAEIALNELRRAREEVEQLTNGSGGSVAFGLSSASTLLFLSRALKPFKKRYPDVSLRISNGIFPVTIPQLRDGQLDFSVGPEPYDALGDDLVVEFLFENVRVATCRKGHAKARATRLAELTSESWVVTSATKNPLLDFNGIFERYSLEPPSDVVLCESSFGIAELLLHSDMIGFLPRQWTDMPFLGDYLTAIPIREKVLGPNISTIRRSNLPLTPAADYLLTLIKRAAVSYQEQTLKTGTPQRLRSGASV
ncbi:MAG: LysR family transcriptional regulator [Alphaproteobacteria bacterium]|nr:LysR family transcriptional regulator [Alphaproteobacteria bacterium]MBL7097294.1 LysR family transcriptional regulator [Alphaproteobacteria bacterium]